MFDDPDILPPMMSLTPSPRGASRTIHRMILRQFYDKMQFLFFSLSEVFSDQSSDPVSPPPRCPGNPLPGSSSRRTESQKTDSRRTTPSSTRSPNYMNPLSRKDHYDSHDPSLSLDFSVKNRGACPCPCRRAPRVRASRGGE